MFFGYRATMGLMGLMGLAALAASLLAGCEAANNALGVQPGNSSRAFAGTSRAQVFDAALNEVKLRFSVAQSDPLAGTIQSQPQFLDSTARTQTGNLHIISSPSDLRRVARVRVQSEEGVVRAEVSVQLQRRDTARYRAYQAIRQEDAPQGTLIDSGAMLSPEQQEVWTAFSRDFTAENEILAAIEAHFTGTTRPAAE